MKMNFEALTWMEMTFLILAVVLAVYFRYEIINWFLNPCGYALLTHGITSLRKIYRENGRIPILDLHNMTLAEARSYSSHFIRRQSANAIERCKIITGRGLHSEDGISILKPAIKRMLLQFTDEVHKFIETDNGGSFLITLRYQNRYYGMLKRGWKWIWRTMYTIFL